MKLSDRPAHRLATLMAERGTNAYRLGAAVWPDEYTDTSRGRIRNIVDGRQSKLEHLEQIAAYLELDPGVFFQAPA